MADSAKAAARVGRPTQRRHRPPGEQAGRVRSIAPATPRHRSVVDSRASWRCGRARRPAHRSPRPARPPRSPPNRRERLVGERVVPAREPAHDPSPAASAEWCRRRSAGRRSASTARRWLVTKPTITSARHPRSRPGVSPVLVVSRQTITADRAPAPGRSQPGGSAQDHRPHAALERGAAVGAFSIRPMPPHSSSSAEPAPPAAGQETDVRRHSGVRWASRAMTSSSSEPVSDARRAATSRQELLGDEGVPPDSLGHPGAGSRRTVAASISPGELGESSRSMAERQLDGGFRRRRPSRQRRSQRSASVSSSAGRSPGHTAGPGARRRRGRSQARRVPASAS